MHDLSRIFGARSVAVVGASSDPEKRGHIILKNILDGGYPGRVYPINPKGGEILGLPAYRSLLEIEGEVDLAVVVIPSQMVPDLVEEAGKKGVGGCVVITGGFRETGNDALEMSIVDLARQHGVRLIGPNCQGINYTYNNLCASWPLLDSKGAMAVASQSGTIGASLTQWAQEDGIGFSAFVSLGNKCDVDEVDLMEYFGQDPNTKVIALYIEGIKDGRKFMDTARKTMSQKPVVVLKAGRTEKGRQAAASHTKSMSGRDELYRAAFKQVGIIEANDITELYDFSKALGFLKTPKGRNVCVITSSGGSGILAADVAEENAVQVVSLDPSIERDLKECLPTHCIIGNPLDLTGDTDAERYEKAVRVASADRNIHTFLLIFGDPIPRAAEVVKRLQAELEQTIIVSYLGGAEVEREESLRMHREGIPVFPTPERAVRALAALLSHVS